MAVCISGYEPIDGKTIHQPTTALQFVKSTFHTNVIAEPKPIPYILIQLQASGNFKKELFMFLKPV